MKHRLLTAAFATALLASCVKNPDVQAPVDSSGSTDAISPDGFNYSTSKNVSLDLTLLTNDNQPLAGVLVNVYAKSSPQSSLFSAFTDASGRINATLTVAAHVDSLLIDPAYIGLMRNATAVISNGAVQATIGGTDGFSGSIIAEAAARTDGGNIYTGRQAGTSGATVVTYFGPYDANGRPTNLVTPSDAISSSLLSFVNTSLPESRSVPNYHPEYLSGSAETNLNIVKTADVWVTFLSEGAGFYNTLGYYTYPTAQPPQTQSDIDTIKLIVPNASLQGSGGAMRSGDKVLIGRFAPGTSIGFVLLQNAWNPNTRTVNTAATKYFADDALNNETTVNKRHTVLLYDSQHNLFLTGFEDQNRSGGGSDNDFNDLVFYSTSNPVDGVSSQNVKPIDQPTDTDGDGVSDVYDKFPTDPSRALFKYFPAEDIWGTVAFEDTWPYTGDYDMNDLVVGYRYAYVTNGQNKTVEMYGDYTVNAVGATYTNGFGVQLPVASSKVSSVTGQRLTGNYVTIGSNGAEAGQTNAVVFPFDDPRALLNTTGFINVYTAQRYVKSDTAHVKISFTSPITAAELGTGVYNPFLVSNGRRAYEVHLPGSKPTDKADSKLFGTGKDNSKPAQNRYYLTSGNWPWALSFVDKFDYPSEGNGISKAYLNFLNWARTGGTTNANWYLNASGNRNAALIYTH